MPRVLEVFIALFSILLLAPVMFIAIVISAIETGSTGIFLQKRVGRKGDLFTIYKLRTMKNDEVTKSGKFFRKYKIDELPQLLNVLIGDMSIVGPRPDVVGYYNELKGENRKILELRPGLTSPAAIAYRNEEELLATQQQPLKYNDEVIFPEKVRMNLHYYHNRNFALDCRIIIDTIKSLIN